MHTPKIQHFTLTNAKMDVYVTTDNDRIVEAAPNFAARCVGSTLDALIAIMEDRGRVTVTEVE